MKRTIDLRSDTITCPSDAMRNAMASADVGDDVFGEDPTVNKLQEKVAALLGKERALFVASGTMGNQTCINAHTQPGDEIICDYNSHIFNYEAASPASLSGVQLHPLNGERGIITADQIEAAIRGSDHHFPQTKLISLENTHNRGGGSIFPLDEMKQIYQLANKYDLRVHLDGARLWHTAVATGTSLEEYCRYCDSVTVCLSKGLGAPIGSVVAGNTDFIDKVHRYRKAFGGGMRQAGIIAAGGIYAIDHHFDRLQEDHQRAKKLAVALNELPSVQIDPDLVETNLVIFQVDLKQISPADLCQKMNEENIRMLPFGKDMVRMVVHLHITDEDIDVVIDRFKKIL